MLSDKVIASLIILAIFAFIWYRTTVVASRRPIAKKRTVIDNDPIKSQKAKIVTKRTATSETPDDEYRRELIAMDDEMQSIIAPSKSVRDLRTNLVDPNDIPCTTYDNGSEIHRPIRKPNRKVMDRHIDEVREEGRRIAARVTQDSKPKPRNTSKLLGADDIAESPYDNTGRDVHPAFRTSTSSYDGSYSSSQSNCSTSDDRGSYSGRSTSSDSGSSGYDSGGGSSCSGGGSD